MAVTIKEIASIAGVSRGTVDKVIHNRPGLRPETYEKVKKVLDDLNYSPHPLAKALVEQHEPCKIGAVEYKANRRGAWNEIRWNGKIYRFAQRGLECEL